MRIMMRFDGRAFAMVFQALALACGGGAAKVADAGFGPSGPPVTIQVGVSDGGATPDGGSLQDRTNQCVPYCNKLFQCGFLPHPGQPQATEASCTSQCSMLGHFPSDALRTCVDSARCSCGGDGGASDGGECHNVHACFPTLTDGGF
jgi:hypothetical protein